MHAASKGDPLHILANHLLNNGPRPRTTKTSIITKQTWPNQQTQGQQKAKNWTMGIHITGFSF